MKHQSMQRRTFYLTLGVMEGVILFSTFSIAAGLFYVRFGLIPGIIFHFGCDLSAFWLMGKWQYQTD